MFFFHYPAEKSLSYLSHHYLSREPLRSPSVQSGPSEGWCYSEWRHRVRRGQGRGDGTYFSCCMIFFSFYPRKGHDDLKWRWSQEWTTPCYLIASVLLASTALCSAQFGSDLLRTRQVLFDCWQCWGFASCVTSNCQLNAAAFLFFSLSSFFGQFLFISPLVV